MADSLVYNFIFVFCHNIIRSDITLSKTAAILFYNILLDKSCIKMPHQQKKIYGFLDFCNCKKGNINRYVVYHLEDSLNFKKEFTRILSKFY